MTTRTFIAALIAAVFSVTPITPAMPRSARLTMSSVTRKAYFLPTISPMRPKKTAPNGRTANPVAKIASARIAPGFLAGNKNAAVCSDCHGSHEIQP